VFSPFLSPTQQRKIRKPRKESQGEGKNRGGKKRAKNRIMKERKNKERKEIGRQGRQQITREMTGKKKQNELHGKKRERKIEKEANKEKEGR
jgi:hypothetical protein